MPLQQYGVLKARPVKRRPATSEDAHYHILAAAAQDRYRLAVSVKSQLAPSELQYSIAPRFQHAITAPLERLAAGWHPLPARPGGLALDYVRAGLVDFAAMTSLPFDAPGPDNDLNEKIDSYVQRAIADPAAWLFAFGEPWGPERRPDKLFGFTPRRGLHNLHMNQGNVGRFIEDDGVWQDGGLLFCFPDPPQWAAIFLKFQSQAIDTDGVTGHALPRKPDEPAE